MSIKFIELMFFRVNLTIIAKHDNAIVFDDNHPLNNYKLTTVHSIIRKSWKLYRYYYKFVPSSLDTKEIVDEVMRELKRNYISDRILKHEPTIFTDKFVYVNRDGDKIILNQFFNL